MGVDRTRRAILRPGSAGFTGGFAGCPVPLDGEDRGRTATVTPAPLPTVDADVTRLPPVALWEVGAGAAVDRFVWWLQ